MRAITHYRETFVASKQLSTSYLMVTVNVLVADTDEEARYHFSSQQQSFINLRRGKPSQVPPPIKDMDSYWSPGEKNEIEKTLAYSFVGSPDTVREGLQNFITRTEPDEVMITAHVYDQAARLHSLELAAQIKERLVSSATN
jgi:alkanesulfonate monooxygenase SsuD/methylene tetrahydromethanopterin reductase-like flavin-dependent oxidoreductase (luciferase family)